MHLIIPTKGFLVGQPISFDVRENIMVLCDMISNHIICSSAVCGCTRCVRANESISYRCFHNLHAKSTLYPLVTQRHLCSVPASTRLVGYCCQRGTTFPRCVLYHHNTPSVYANNCLQAGGVVDLDPHPPLEKRNIAKNRENSLQSVIIP